MTFKDFSKYYKELYPDVTPVSSQVVETMTGAKDIANEVEETVVHNTWVAETPKDAIQEQKEEKVEDNGTTGTDNRIDE